MQCRAKCPGRYVIVVVCVYFKQSGLEQRTACVESRDLWLPPQSGRQAVTEKKMTPLVLLVSTQLALTSACTSRTPPPFVCEKSSPVSGYGELARRGDDDKKYSGKLVTLSPSWGMFCPSHYHANEGSQCIRIS